MKLKFYDVDKKYIEYMKNFEHKIPNISYDKHDKFICGIIFNINNCDYYAPISSFNKQQKTNVLIKNNKNQITSSIRLSFMFPVPKELVSVRDFSKEDEKYSRLLNEELNFCNNNINKIVKTANYVYDEVTKTKNSLMVKNCCNFKLLEQKCLQYCKENNLKLPLSPVQTIKKEKNSAIQDYCKNKGCKPALEQKIDVEIDR